MHNYKVYLGIKNTGVKNSAGVKWCRSEMETNFIIINRTGGTCIYRQLSKQITTAVEKGLLKPGDRLPAERSLSEKLGISRGTVNKAYEDLRRRGIIRSMPCSGAFVSGSGDISGKDMKAAAVAKINETIAALHNLHFTYEEMRALFDRAVAEIELNQNPHAPEKLYIATIDCNPESMAIFKEQFSGLESASVNVKMFLLEDMAKYHNPEKVFEDYDIIVTTTTHFEQVLAIIPSLKEKLFKVAVAPAEETVIQLATMSKDSRIGLIIRSINFKNLVIARLGVMGVNISGIRHAFENDNDDLERLCSESSVLIIPHFLLIDNLKLAGWIQRFRECGGIVIDFRYQIETGSLIHIEEKIRRLLAETEGR